MGSILFNVGSSDKRLTAHEAAYLAGFVDGEGCLTIGRARRKESRAGFSYEALMNVSGTELEALRQIAVMCGNGKVQVQDKRSSEKHKPLYRIVFSANQIRHLLPQIRPYLLVKHRQADIVLTFLSERQSGRNVTPAYWQRQEELRAQVRTLNRRGLIDTSAQVVAVRETAQSAQRQCSVDGCEEKHYGSGLCFPHYYAHMVRPRREAKKAERLARHDRVCVVCGRSFTAQRSDTRCCSRLCAHKRYYAQHADRIRAQVAARKRRLKELKPS